MKTVELKWIEDDNHTVAKDACDTLQGLIDGGAFPDLGVKCEDDTLYITGEKEVLDRAVMKIQKAFAKYGQIMMKEAKNGTTEELRIESFDDNVQDIFNHTLAEYETFKENTKEERPNTYITTLGKFQYKFNKLKEAAAKKDKKILQNILMEIDELSESYEEVKFKPMNKLEEGKLIDSAALMVYSQLVDLGYKHSAQQIILNNIDYINDHSNDNPSELTDNIIKRWKRQEKRKNKEYEKLNNESYEEINEDSLDDFKPGTNLDNSKKYFLMTAMFGNGVTKQDIEKALKEAKAKIIYIDDKNFGFVVKNEYNKIKSVLNNLLAFGERTVWYIHFKCSNDINAQVTMYSNEISNDLWYNGDIDKIMKVLTNESTINHTNGKIIESTINEDYNFYRNRYRQMAEKRKRASEEKKRNLSKETFGKKFLELAQTYAGVEGLDIEVAYDKLMSDNRVFELVDSTMSIEDIMDKISAGELLQ